VLSFFNPLSRLTHLVVKYVIIKLKFLLYFIRAYNVVITSSNI
jgi:hypothetical protein